MSSEERTKAAASESGEMTAVKESAEEGVRLYGVRIALEEFNVAEDTYRDIRYLEGDAEEEILWAGEDYQLVVEMGPAVGTYGAQLAKEWGYPEAGGEDWENEAAHYAVWVETLFGEVGQEGPEAFDFTDGTAVDIGDLTGATFRTVNRGTAVAFAALLNRRGRTLCEEKERAGACGVAGPAKE